MTLTKEELNAMDACPILKMLKPFFISLDPEEEEKEEEDDDQEDNGET